MKKEADYITDIKKCFCIMLKEKMNIDVIRIHVKHEVDKVTSDIIKFTVSSNDINGFIYVYVNRQNKKTIEISTNISETFLNELSTLLMPQNTAFVVSDFNARFIDFTTKYSLLELSTFNEVQLSKVHLLFVRSYSSHSYFYIMQNHSTHFVNSKLYDISNSMIMISTKIMFRYENNTFVSYPYLKIKFGTICHEAHLYSFKNMQKDISSLFSKFLLEIEPTLQHIFYKLFDIDEGRFKQLDSDLFDDHLSVIAMQHI